jgi:thioredoxin 1
MLELWDFYADWCPPCKITTPIVEELEKEFAGKVTFKKIDVDKSPDEAAKYGVMSIPTFVLVRDGQEVSRKMGAISKSEFNTWLKENLP